MMAFGRVQKKRQKKGTCEGPNKGDLYATDAITYHIPDERLCMWSKIVFQIWSRRGEGGGGSSLVAAASFVLAVKQMCAAENENWDQKLCLDQRRRFFWTHSVDNGYGKRVVKELARYLTHYLQSFHCAAMLIKGSSYIINPEVLPKWLQPALSTLLSDIRDRKLPGLL